MARGSHKDNYLLKTLNGFAYGFFISFVIGNVLKQIGYAMHFNDLVYFGKVCIYLMGPCIGASMAYVLEAKGINAICAIICASIGAGTFLNGSIQAGQPILAYLCVLLVIEMIRLLDGKLPFDIWVIPLLSIICSGYLVRFIQPYIMSLMHNISQLINEGIALNPLFMGIIVAMLSGMVMTSPISSLAIVYMLDLNGLACGAILAGSCAQMIGLAIMSIEDNSLGDVLAVAFGSSMLQFKNILKRPIIWIPPILASMLSGFISTYILHIQCSAYGAGMGMCGFIGLFECISVMGQRFWLPLILVDVILPLVVCFSLYKAFYKLRYIKSGDMKLTGL